MSAYLYSHLSNHSNEQTNKFVCVYTHTFPNSVYIIYVCMYLYVHIYVCVYYVYINIIYMHAYILHTSIYNSYMSVIFKIISKRGMFPWYCHFQFELFIFIYVLLSQSNREAIWTNYFLCP